MRRSALLGLVTQATLGQTSTGRSAAGELVHAWLAMTDFHLVHLFQISDDGSHDFICSTSKHLLY